MSVLRLCSAMACCLFCAASLLGQKEKREPLTETQIEAIREAGNNPDERVKLYTKYLDDHAETLKALGKRVHSSARAHRISDELLDFTALMDELGSNLDTYSDRKADIRKALKLLNEATPRWLEVLRSLDSEPVYELALKESIESHHDLAEQAATLLKDQTDYFQQHKDEQGQERAEPK